MTRSRRISAELAALCGLGPAFAMFAAIVTVGLNL